MVASKEPSTTALSDGVPTVETGSERLRNKETNNTSGNGLLATARFTQENTLPIP